MCSTAPCIHIMRASGGGARPRATETFTKAVIRVVTMVVSSLRVVAGLQRLLSFLANSEFISARSFLRNIFKCAYIFTRTAGWALMKITNVDYVVDYNQKG